MERKYVLIFTNALSLSTGKGVMKSDGKHAAPIKHGTVDECRNQIIDLLEGGREAFQERSRRYQTDLS